MSQPQKTIIFVAWDGNGDAFHYNNFAFHIFLKLVTLHFNRKITSIQEKSECVELGLAPVNGD
jgi:hypothetical protein